MLTWDPLPAFDTCRAPVGPIQNGAMHPDAAERYRPFTAHDLHMRGHGHLLHLEDPEVLLTHLDAILEEVAAIRRCCSDLQDWNDNRCYPDGPSIATSPETLFRETTTPSRPA